MRQSLLTTPKPPGNLRKLVISGVLARSAGTQSKVTNPRSVKGSDQPLMDANAQADQPPAIIARIRIETLRCIVMLHLKTCVSPDR